RLSNAHTDLAELVSRLRARPEVRFFATLLGSVDIVAEMVLPEGVDYGRLVSEITEGTSAAAESLLITHAFASGQDWAPPRESTDPTRLAPRGDGTSTSHRSDRLRGKGARYAHA